MLPSESTTFRAGCGANPGGFSVKKVLAITLGIMTALGGFVDLGQIVFTTQAGALFGYRFLWAIVLGTVAIIVYMEMCGRVAVVAHEPVFSVVRERLGMKLGIVTFNTR
jgi:manganese transport protein